ncbi:MAG: hypothetical protein Q8865_04175 [Bacillota bacterium]|nr:hypothetical protein [Bacillota bacterium]
MPQGTTSAPTVCATASSSSATISYTQATSTSGTAQILVSAEDGISTKTYTIQFTIAS